MRVVLFLLVSAAYGQMFPAPGPSTRAPASGGGGGGITHIQTLCVAGADNGSCPTGGTGQTGTTRVISITATTGNTLFIVPARYGSQTITGISDGVNTYTEDVNSPSSPAADTVGIWRAKNITGGALTITVTLSAAGAFTATYAMEFSGLTGDPDCTPGVGNGSSTTPASSACVTSTANAVVIAAWASGAGGNVTSTAGTGYAIPTNGKYTDGNAQVASAVEYQIVSSTGSFTGEFTSGTSNQWHALVAAYK